MERVWRATRTADQRGLYIILGIISIALGAMVLRMTSSGGLRCQTSGKEFMEKHVSACQ